ncbi:MAG TPA: flagellar basal body P-ring formation chaperone FlgA [bacterium]|jgi:flagella basal body P-ring formation protein FlgA
MNTRFSLLITLLIPLCLHAETAECLVQRLIADAWSPRSARVEWTFSGKVPADLGAHDDWKLCEPRPTRLAGNIILAFERTDGGATRRIVVTGTAHVFGPCLTVKQTVPAGQPVQVANLDSISAEWTYLNGDAAQLSDFSAAKVATRALTQGKPITTRDIKGAKLVHRGQNVSVYYAEGSVRIRISGRALCDGAMGDVVPVSTELVASRRLSGTVSADGSIQLER